MSTPLPTSRLWRSLRSEWAGLHCGRIVSDLLVALIPRLAFPRLRTRIYRLAGVQAGRTTLIAGSLTLQLHRQSRGRLRIGDRCWINAHVFVDLGADITIGNDVTIGHHCRLITVDHEIGEPERRCGATRAAPLVIEDGAWLGAGVSVLPGVTIGRGAVVAAGAVVRHDVAPDTLVGGVPARPLRDLPRIPRTGKRIDERE